MFTVYVAHPDSPEVCVITLLKQSLQLSSLEPPPPVPVHAEAVYVQLCVHPFLVMVRVNTAEVVEFPAVNRNESVNAPL